jgi:hypothetical protein
MNNSNYSSPSSLRGKKKFEKKKIIKEELRSGESNSELAGESGIC